MCRLFFWAISAEYKDSRKRAYGKMDILAKDPLSPLLSVSVSVSVSVSALSSLLSTKKLRPSQ